MKKKLGVAKQLFQELACLHSNEIKAKDAYPCIKYHILETIARKELSISYIVADLKYIKPALLEDKNILYNYLMKILIDSLVSESDNSTILNIICDNHTTKIASGNSFEEYIKLHLIYEKDYDIKLNIIYTPKTILIYFYLAQSNYYYLVVNNLVLLSYQTLLLLHHIY